MKGRLSSSVSRVHDHVSPFTDSFCKPPVADGLVQLGEVHSFSKVVDCDGQWFEPFRPVAAKENGCSSAFSEFIHGMDICALLQQETSNVLLIATDSILL